MKWEWPRATGGYLFSVDEVICSDDDIKYFVLVYLLQRDHNMNEEKACLLSKGLFSILNHQFDRIIELFKNIKKEYFEHFQDLPALEELQKQSRELRKKRIWIRGNEKPELREEQFKIYEKLEKLEEDICCLQDKIEEETKRYMPIFAAKVTPIINDALNNLKIQIVFVDQNQ
jgi:hypothetical protein